MSTPQEHQTRHPTFRQYVFIAIFLFVITIIEFAIILPKGLRGTSVVIAPLVILSAIKFAMVIMFYMHLKFDSRLFTYIFIGGLALGLAVGIALIGLFGTFTPQPREFAEANAVAFEHGEGETGPQRPGPTIAPQPTTPPDTGQPTAAPPTQEPSGGADLVAQGQEAFMSATVPTCASCHMIQGISAGPVGPDLTHIGTDAATRNPGMDARAYIEESIRSPEAFVAQGVERAFPGVMTSAITTVLSDEEVEALVEFLLAQK